MASIRIDEHGVLRCPLCGSDALVASVATEYDEVPVRMSADGELNLDMSVGVMMYRDVYRFRCTKTGCNFEVTTGDDDEAEEVDFIHD
jgi:hypothetical protein